MNKIVRPSIFSRVRPIQKPADFNGELHSTISYRTLEPRIAFDGAAAATAAAAVDQQQADTTADGSIAATGEPAADAGVGSAETPADNQVSQAANLQPSADSSVDLSESLAVAIADIGPRPQGQTIVFIDSSVENIDRILSSINPDSEVVLIDGQSSGLDQIAAHLSGRSNIDSIHIVSHGEAGTLYLGGATLNSSNLAGHQAQLALIGQALSESGDILLYGCEIASGTGGMDFVRAFADLTGADVAASTNDTGGDEAGGDWVLEATAGAIETSTLNDPFYASVLAKTNTGAWSISGLMASNTADGITTKVTFANAGSSTWSTPTNDTLNNVAGGLLATTFDNGAVGGASLSTIWNSTNTTDVGTVTITFSTAVTNPILHLDRLGGVSGTSNSSLWTLTTAGATLTKVSGVTHFLVDTAAGTITEQLGQASLGSQSNTNIASGSSAGSVRINGTFTTITFNVRMNPGAGAGIGDGFELAFAIDAPPVAVTDTFTTAHDTPVTINVRANDSDIRGDALNVTQVNGAAITAGGAGVAVTGGMVTLNAAGNLVFAPNANYLGAPSFTYTIADANGGTSTVAVSGTVTNVAPALDLDSSGAGSGWTATFGENGSAVSIADIDAAIADIDDSNMESATITLTNQQTGDRLLVNGSAAASGTLASGITWTRTDTAVTLSGSFTRAQFTAAIQLIRFENTSDTPSATPRIINTIVNDGHVNSNIAVTTINVDRAPDPVNDAYSGNEDAAISGTVLTNDDLGDTPIASVTIASGPANGTLTAFNTATGAFVYTPGANFNGSDTFTYTVTDADGDTKTATVTITVNPVNDLPIAGNDTFTTVHDQPVTISVLANDSDVETPVLSITQINGLPITVGGLGVAVTGGVVTLNAGGTLTFTPNADYAGSPSFTYTVADSNGATAKATVSGTVTNVGPALDLDASGAGTGWTTTFTENGAAVAIADLDAAIVDADDANMSSATVTLTNPQTSDRLLVNGSSAASGTLASGIAWTRTNSVVTLSGSFTKAQYAAALAVIQFENTSETPSTVPRIVNVIVNDGTANSKTAVATVNVNLAPDPVDDAYTGNEDTAISGNVLANDTDLGTTPSVANPLSVDSGPSNGTLTSFNTATGAFSYTPTANFAGTDSFVYRYTDGNGDSKTATVTFTIDAVDDIPFIDLNSEAAPGDKDRDFVTEFATGSGTPIAIADIDADIFEDGEDDVVKVTIVAGGKGLDGSDILTIAGQSFKLDSDAAFIGVGYGGSSLDIVYDASTRTITVTYSGDPSKPIPQDEFDKLVREITYLSTSITQPPTNRTFEFTVTDAGKNTSPAAVATVVFLPPPDAVDDAFTTVHDTPVTIDVLSNDKDPQSDPISVTHVNGTAIVAGGAGVAVTGGVVTLDGSGNLVFTPTAGYAGSTSFTYAIADITGGQDTATVTGTVTNIAPTLDIDGTPPSNISVTGGAGPAFSNGNGGGTHVRAFDLGTGGVPETAQIVVGLTFVDNSFNIILNGQSITSGSAIQLEGAAGVGQVKLSFGGSDISTPWLSNPNGPRIRVVITEAGISFEGLRTTSSTAYETMTITGGSLLLADIVSGSNTITVVNPDESGADAMAGTIAVTAEEPGNFTTTFTENGAAVSIADTDAIVYDSDDTNMESATVTLTNPQTGDRLLVNGSSATTGAIGAITWTRTNTTVTLSGPATKADYAAAIKLIQFENATDTPSTTPRIVNTIVNDGTINSNTAVTTINIDIAPDPVNDAVSGNEDTAIGGNVLTNDSDHGNTPITSVTVSVPPANGTLTSFNTATGAFVYTPAANFNGTDTFTYTLTDADGDSKTATVTIAVAPANDAPVNTVPGAQTTSEDTPLAITGVSVGDVDGAGVALTATLSIPAGSGALGIASLAGVTVTGAGTANMTVSGTAAAINAAIATITYTPLADFNTGSPATPINLTVSTSDGIAPAVANTVAITVTPVADIAANSVTTNEDAPVTFAPLANDSFENAGRTITAINGTAISAGGPGVVLAGVGTVTLDASGNLTYTPVANYNGTPSFNYTVTSGGVTETASVNLTVTAINDAPVQTVPVGQTTNEDTAKVITGASVADVDGGTLTTTLSIPAGTGTLSVVTGGGAAISGNASRTVSISGTAAQVNAAIASITYIPEPDYFGTAPMSISTTDGTATAASTVAIAVAPVADATDDAVTTNEDTSHTFNVLTGTNGATADTFEGVEAVTAVTQPANGSVAFAAGGTITYTPSADFNGTDTFTYTVTSGGVTETATVTVTVSAVNDAPVNTVPGAQTTSEDTGLVFNAANGNAITIVDVDSNVTTTLTAANGALTLGSIAGVTVTGNGTGTVTVTGSSAAVTAALAGLAFGPAPDWNGATTLNISTSDGVAPATVSAVAITVSPVVDIAPNNVTTAEDTASTFNVLTNDNFESAGAVVSAVAQPAHGSVTIGAGGNVTYTPAANYNGTDTFTYTVTSGGVTETTTVTMSVLAVNDAPVASPAANQSGTDGAADSYNAGALFSDVDNATLTFAATGLPSGLSIDPATGLISGTIGQHASVAVPGGVYSVTVTATDASGALATTTFNWTVANPAPVAVDDSYTGSEDNAITGNVRTNDSDPDGDALTVNTTPVAGPANGTLVLNSNGTFTYTSAANFTGTDTFTYQVTDADGATSTATVTLYVNPVNDSPLNTVPGNQSTAEDTPLVFKSTNGNAITVTDVDSPVVETTLSVAHGTFTLGSLAGVTVVGDGTGSVTLTGSPAAITAALSGLQYVNNPDYHGSDTLNIVSSDGVATTTANLALTVSPVADIAADTVTTNEDAGISFNVLTGTNGATADTFEGSPNVTGYTQPANGSVTIDAGGNVVYTPNANFNGTETFSYTVTSGGVTETTTVTVNVTPANDVPTLAVPAAQNAPEDTPVIFSGANGNQIVLGDIDSGAALTTTIGVPAGTLTAISNPLVTIIGNGSGTITISGPPAAITAALNGLTYTPVADFNGSVSMSISTTDGIAAPVTGAVAISLAPVSDIQNDNAPTNEDSAKIISVLGNDTFENAGAAVTSVTNGVNGVVAINGDGTVTYTPNANFNGSDSFTYTVTSGGVTETATVTVVVSPVNDAPVQTVPAAQVTAEDAGLSFSPATGNAITVADLDGDTLTTTVSVTNGTIDLGAFAGVTVGGNNTGTVTITGSAAAINAALDGLTFNPTPDYHGGAIMSVTTSDGTASASNTIALTVTTVTDIAADAIATNEDTPVTFNVMTNDTFENAGAAITGVTQPAHGTVSIGAGGQVTYTPAANYNGPDSFTYTVTSGGVSETATVAVAVASINDAPVTVVPGGQTTNEDAALVLSSANANAITVSDLDGDTLTVTLSGTNGRLTLGSALGVIVSGDGTGTVTVTGSAAAINTALNGLTFAPTADYNGTAAINVTTTDGTVTTSKTIGITVNPVADVVADTVSTSEDVPVTFNVLSNDNFESPGKAVTGITQGASGTASFLADGTLVYTPNTNFHGTDTFTYTVTSGGVTETTTVTVTIGDVNDIPTTTGLADRSSLDGQAVSVDVSASFADSDGEILAYSASGLPAGISINPVTGVITGTIDKSASQTGPYTVVVTASDGHPGGSVSTSFTWNVANPGPTAVNDTATVAEDTPAVINVLANDTDPDSDPLTVAAVTAGNGTVTINGDGTINYTPDANFNGSDTIVYQISDGNGGVSTASVTVTVTPVNDAPTLATFPGVPAGELPGVIDSDGQDVNIDISSAFSDLDGDALTYSISGLPPGLSFNPATGQITGTIDPNASNPSGDKDYPITIIASDGMGGTVTATFTWNVLNIPPAASNDAVTTPEDTPVVATVLSNDFDPDGDPISITHINGTPISPGDTVNTAHGQVTLQKDAFGNQVLVYTPNANFNGVESLVYTMSDGNSGIDTATLTITVTPQNDAPAVDTLANLTNNDSDTPSIDVSAFFHDIDTPEGDTFAFSAIGLPPGLSINPATGVISGTIDASASQSGPYTVIVMGTDDGGASVSQTFTWTVNNPKPTAVNDSQIVTQGTNADVDAASGILGNDSDPDNDPLTVSAINGSAAAVGTSVAGSSGGLFTVQPDGSYTFDQNGAFIDLQGGETRTTLVTYTLSDGNGGLSTATLSITVTGVNDAPVATPLDPVSTLDNAPLTLNAAAAFTDADGDTLKFAASGLPAGLSIDPDTGLITGTIDKAASQGGAGGVYTVTIFADDQNGGITPVTLTITIANPAPVAANDVALVVEDTPATGNVLSNDTDPDGDTLSVSDFSIAGVSGTFLPGDIADIPGVGTIEINSTGAYTFTPAPNYIGPVPEITYTVTDNNGGSATATLNLGPVSPVNDDPTSTPIAANSSADSALVSVNLASNFADIDGDALTFVATGLPPGLSIDPDTGMITGTIDHLASAAGGTYSVTVTATDPDGRVTSQVFVWTVTNPAPIGPDIPDAGGVDNTPVSIAAGAGFSDPDGDTLAFGATGLPAGLTINPATGVISGSLTKNASVGGPLTNGIYEITVTATDSQGATVSKTFTYTVTNPPPAAGNDTFFGVEDAPITGSVGGNDSDPDGDAVSYVLVTEPAHGTLTFNPDGTFTYIPDPDFNTGSASETFTYLVSDANGATATATVTLNIAPVNDAPAAPNVITTTPEETPLNGTLTASDIDGDILSFAKASNPSNGTVVVNLDGTYTYTPNPNFTGTDTFTFKVSDGNGGTIIRSVTVTVSGINDAPVAVNDAFSGNEDTNLTGDVTPGTSGQDSDADGDTLVVSDADGNAANGITPVTGPAHGTLVLNANGTFVYTPQANFTGTDSFVYRISDGNGGFSEATVSLTVNPVNDAPVAANDALTTKEDQPFAGQLPAATDAEGNPITYAKGSNPAHGTVVVKADGTYVYKPAPNYYGTDSFTYTVSDGKGGVRTYTVTILVTPVNDAPVAHNDTGTVRPGSSVSIPAVGNDTDIDGDKLTVTKATAGQGTVRILPDGSVGYTPRAGFTGTDTITYIVSDGHGGFATATISIVVEDAGYADQPVVFGFDGPSIMPVNDNATSAGGYPSIGAEGAVLDAVFDMGSLRSLAGQLGTNGIVLAAANGARSLSGIGWLGTNGIITETTRAERAREMMSYAGLDLRVFGGGIDGLTGFSLRNNVPGNLSGLGSEEQLIIESLVRNRTLIIQISNTIDPGTKRIVDYKITQPDGKPLPQWLDRAGRDLLIGERSAVEEFVKIRVEAIYSDGSVVVEEVKIETSTGEIKPLNPGRQGSLAPALFGDQFRARPMLSPDQVHGLARAIAR